MKDDYAKQSDLIATQKDVQALQCDVTILKDDVSVLKEDVTLLKEDMKELKADVVLLKEDVKELKADVALLKEDVKELKVDVKRLDEKMDKGFKDADDKMHAMFEKFTTVILEAINDSVEKVKDETHLNTMRKIEVERDRYGVLFEIHNDHDTKIKGLDKRVLKLEEYA